MELKAKSLFIHDPEPKKTLTNGLTPPEIFHNHAVPNGYDKIDNNRYGHGNVMANDSQKAYNHPKDFSDDADTEKV